MNVIAGIVLFAIAFALGAFTRGIVHTVMRRPTKPMDHGQLVLWSDEY